MRLLDLKPGQASVGFMGLHWNLQLLLHASSHLAEPVGHEVFSEVEAHPQHETFGKLIGDWPIDLGFKSSQLPPRSKDVSEGWGGRCVFINFIDQASAV